MDRDVISLQAVDTPLLELEAYEFEDYREHYAVDPIHTIGQRMIFILVVVGIVTFALGFLALPATGQSVANAPVANSAKVDGQSDLYVESNPQLITDISSSGDQIAAFFTPEVQYWESSIVEWATEHEVDPNAIATIMQIESCGDPQAVSGAGARGLFQVMPFHFSSGEDMLDPDTNAMRGMNFFNEQLRYTGGDVFLSFAGYNGGYAASGGDYANWANETQRYYGWAKGIYEDATAGLDRSETLEAWLAAGGAAGCQRAASRLELS